MRSLLVWPLLAVAQVPGAAELERMRRDACRDERALDVLESWGRAW